MAYRLARMAFRAALLSAALSAHCQEHVLPDLKLYFEPGSDTLSLSFRENGRYLDSYTASVRTLAENPSLEVRSLSVSVFVSPDGDLSSNELQALRRARSVRSAVSSRLGESFEVHAVIGGVNWDMLCHTVQQSPCPWKMELLPVLTRACKAECQECVTDTLRLADSGRAWMWLRENVFISPALCPAVVTCDIAVRPAAASPATALTADSVRSIVAETVAAILAGREAVQRQRELQQRELQKREQERQARTAGGFAREGEFREPRFALRTNLLLPLMNIGFEVPLINCLSLSADACAPWIQRRWMNSLTSTDNVWCLQAAFGMVDVRYWPGATHRRGSEGRRYRLRGHSIGVLFGGGIYDFERPFEGTVTEGLIPVGQGWQGSGLAAGVSYMYAQPLGRGGVHLEFEVAFGYVHSDYQEYYVYSEKDGRCFRRGSGGSHDGFYPLKAGVSLAVPLCGR